MHDHDSGYSRPSKSTSFPLRPAVSGDGVGGGQGISLDNPLLKESSIFSFIEKA